MNRFICLIAIVCLGVAVTTAMTYAAPVAVNSAGPGTIDVGSLVVKVLDKYESPVDSAKVWVLIGGTEKVAARNVTDRGGIVFFEQLKSGDYTVYVSKDKMGEGKRSISITPNQQSVISIVLN